LRLPQGAAFIPQPEAGGWAAVSGDDAAKDLNGPDLAAIVTPTADGESWTAYLDYHAGHVDDTQARAGLPLPQMLAIVEGGLARDNQARAGQDLPAQVMSGWLVQPDYDASGHRLLWAATIGDADATDEDDSTRIHGYALGKDGYFQMTLIAPAAEAAQRVAIGRALLGGIVFNPGQRYDDYASTSDGPQRDVASLIGEPPPGIVTQAADVLARSWTTVAIGLVVLLLAIGIFWHRRRA
jgi:uncharacterized membrane-anchored protein